MFFSEDFLMVKPGGLGIFWLAATLGAKGRKGLNKKQILDCNITEACQKIINPPQPIALRASAGLMMGVVKIHDARYDMFVSDVTTLESAVKRAIFDGPKGTMGNEKVNAGNKANARSEAITVHHQPGQGFAPNLDLNQASWEGFLKGYGRTSREPSANPFSSQEQGTDNDTSDSGKSFASTICLQSIRSDPNIPAARAQSRSLTPEPERARNLADPEAINLPRYRHRSGSLLPGTQQGSDAEDIAPGPAFFTPPGAENLLRQGGQRGSGTGSVLLAGGMADSSFSAGEGGVYYVPGDLGFDLGLDLPPLEDPAGMPEAGNMEIDKLPVAMNVDQFPLEHDVGAPVDDDMGVPPLQQVDINVDVMLPKPAAAPRPKKKVRLVDESIEFTREEMEEMKASYKTRMTDAKHQKLSEEARKEAINHARNGIAQPFGTQISIASDLANFWIVVTKPLYDADKVKRNENARRRKTGAGEGFDGNLEDLGLLPLDDDVNLHGVEVQNYDEIGGERLGSDELRDVEMGRRASGLQMPWEVAPYKPASDLEGEDYYAGPVASSTIGPGTGPRLSLATPQNAGERIAKRARSSSIMGSNISASAQKKAMLGDSPMMDEGELELPEGAFPEDQVLPLEEDEPSHPSLPGHVNVNERQFLDYLHQQAQSGLPDEDDDVFDNDNTVMFSEIARPNEHKKGIAVNAFYLTLTLITKNLISVEQDESYGDIEIKIKRGPAF